MRSPSERPPPISTLKPTVPSACSAGHRPMSLISTRAQSSVHPATATLNLRGRLAYSRLPVKKRRNGLGHGQCRNDFLLVDARDGARAHVAGGIAARLDGGQTDIPEALPNPGDVGDADPVELNVLPRREVCITVPENRTLIGSFGERVGRDTDLPNLGRGHDAARDLDAHHERVATLALGIHTDPLEALELAGHVVDGIDALLRIRLDDCLGDLEGVPRQLQLLDRVELADVAVGLDEFEPAVASTTELHPIGIVEVARH